MIDFFKQRKKVVIIVLIIIFLGGYYILYSKNDYKTEDVQYNTLTSVEEDKNEENTDEENEEVIVVHITGAVKKPGVVKIIEGSRIEDVIEEAGGLTEDADISSVNLAYVVDDGVKIRIPSINDEVELDDGYITEDSGDGVIISDNADTTNDSKMVNINLASQTELETLPGIGPSLAGRIISYREENGDFKDIEDIKNVTSIGDSKFDNIKDSICVK